MKERVLGASGVKVSRLVYGCMRLVDGDRSHGKRAVQAAIDAGFTIFDHADIYGGGECERLFGEVLAGSPGLREQLFLVSKCGIRFAGDRNADAPKRYDFSRKHILASVEGSLRRLDTDRLDLLLLHRPDLLGDPGEIAAAFAELKASGKVRWFGVSNFRPSQLSLLASAVDEPLIVNQVEISLARLDAFDDGTLDQCTELGIVPQAWSPLRGAVLPSADAEADARVRRELDRQSEHYGVADWVVALAWLLKHPAGIAPVIGSTNAERIRLAPASLGVDYTREDWYRLLEARNGCEVA